MKRLLAFMLVALTFIYLPAHAWWPAGHSTLSEAAVRALPREMPSYFRRGGAMIAHCAQDPDVVKQRDLPNANDSEQPEHYIDYELLQGRALPPTRYQYVQLCAELKLDPKEVGLLPYAVAEWTERLAMAFAEHRRWPHDYSIRSKSLVYAGFLAHYAQDMCMPLHVTVHHDGRANPDGSSPRTGIHAKVDSLIQKLALKPADLAKHQTIEPVPELMPAIFAELNRSRSLVDRVYELESSLPVENGAWRPRAEISDFTTERGREATRFTAVLCLTAWRKSASLSLPAWLERGRRQS
ncbi:MAG TPA: hypothetical protein VNA16_09475 [Abditibacteriaceae bacterium]|nr:hypothetical protein [Abditibacteriaceae bacterium]